MKKDSLSLSVSARDTKESPRTLRKAGDVPGVVYGSSIKGSTSIKCKAKSLQSIYVKAGENNLITIDLGGKAIPCLIHAVSFEPVTGSLEHVDFYAVDMTKKVTTNVPIIVEGESPAVKTQGGVLVTVHDVLEVSCLPADIPSHFIVNIGKLENFRDSILVKDVVVPTGVTVKTNPETVVVTVQEPRKEEVIEVVAPTAEGVPAEGAAAGEGAAAPGAPAAAPGAKPDDKAAGKDKAAKK
jgi:large subunit ribosomal protein L25